MPFLRSIAVVAGPLALFVVLTWAILRFGWRPWMKRYPARPPHPDAVRRSYQSFSIAVVNGGPTMHVAVDEDYLHLTPVRVLRWLGAGPLSVPWSSIKVTRRSRRGTRATAKFDGRTVYGPAWCLELAEGKGDEGSEGVRY
jgi:hypothetical protein